MSAQIGRVRPMVADVARTMPRMGAPHGPQDDQALSGMNCAAITASCTRVPACSLVNSDETWVLIVLGET